jgi:hypothetical protein
MDVSVNYPWGSDWQIVNGRRITVQSPGWDFGDAPAGYGQPYWRARLAGDLAQFAEWGIRAVRMAILFNGLTYGIDAQAPQPTWGGDWDFVPVPLSQKFRDDFRDLVLTFAGVTDGQGAPRVKLMPCLFGFELVTFNVPPPPPVPRLLPTTDWTDFVANGIRYRSGRRIAALRPEPMPGTRPQRTRQEMFLRYVVDDVLSDFDPGGPLAQHANVIHSIDLCGEPEDFIRERRQRPALDKLEQPEILDLLNAGIERINAHGLPATVGFRFLRTYQDPAWWTLAPHRGQFHYYDGERLPLVHAGAPAIIGEAATTATSPFDRRVTAAVGQSVPLMLRLEWFERLRYSEVFLWSAGRAEPDTRHSWTAVEINQVRRFARGERPNRSLIERIANSSGVPA